MNPPPPPSPARAYEVHHHHYHRPKSAAVAVLLEVLPGFLIQTFGIGHLYAGNVAAGLLFMFGYWLLQGANVVLLGGILGVLTLGVGTLLAVFVGGALWLVFMLVSPLVAGVTTN